MTERIIKFIGALETSANTTANSFTSSTGGRMLLRVYNGLATNATITVANTSGTVGSMTLASGEEIFLRKEAGDTLVSNVATGGILCVPIAIEN